MPAPPVVSFTTLQAPFSCSVGFVYRMMTHSNESWSTPGWGIGCIDEGRQSCCRTWRGSLLRTLHHNC